MNTDANVGASMDAGDVVLVAGAAPEYALVLLAEDGRVLLARGRQGLAGARSTGDVAFDGADARRLGLPTATTFDILVGCRWVSAADVVLTVGNVDAVPGAAAAVVGAWRAALAYWKYAGRKDRLLKAA